MRSALMVEGELPEDGLAVLEGDGQDVFLSLARRLAEQSAGDGQSLEALFAQARQSEMEAEDYLVDGEWEVETARSSGAGSPSWPVNGEAADLWRRIFTGEPANAAAVREVPAGPHSRVVSFEELERLVRRPKLRRKSIPEGQLALFGGQ